MDSYSGHLAIQTLHPGMERRLPEILELLEERLPPASMTLRHDSEVRQLEGLPLEVKTVFGKLPELVEVQEGHVRLLVDLGRPENRALPGPAGESAGRGGLARGEVLDAFAYQGGFALHLAPGARRVTLVESSEAALAVAQENARINGFDNLELVRDNVFAFLKKAVAAARRFDLIILDPPAFAKSRKERAGALKGYLEINRRAFQLLAPGGVLFTCSCSYNQSETEFLEGCGKRAAVAHRQARLVERRGAARDHPALLPSPRAST